MLQISAQQLAELLAGIARAQAAVVNGLESELAGVRSGRIIPAVQNALWSMTDGGGLQARDREALGAIQ